MKARILLLTSALGLLILSTGCYTKLYRPGMEDSGPFSEQSLYNRYDSTAIDTTLTKPETVYVYPDYNYYDPHGWSYWGRPRTRWGFDFDRFSPNYHWSYYGYYDYYSRPWWHDWHHNHGHGHWGNPGPGVPGEPPSQRPGRRSSNVTPPPANIGGGGGGPVYAPNPTPVTPNNPTPPTVKDPQPQEDNSQKRNGKRRR